jgi:hypothetical protein
MAKYKGTKGDDQIHGTPQDDILDGGVGSDQLHGENGNDELYGGNNDNFGWEYLDGGNGNDELYGGGGGDNLYGGEGDDVLDGGAGADYFYGWNGSDTYVPGTGDDYMDDYENDPAADADVFVFVDPKKLNFGHDYIGGFDDGYDQIRFVGYEAGTPGDTTSSSETYSYDWDDPPDGNDDVEVTYTTQLVEFEGGDLISITTSTYEEDWGIDGTVDYASSSWQFDFTDGSRLYVDFYGSAEPPVEGEDYVFV